MWTLRKLLNTQCVILEKYNGTFVIIKIAVVGGREYCDYSREFFRAWPFVHFKSFVLSLMRSNDRNDFIFLEKAFGQLESKKVRASSHFIGLCYFLQRAILVINRISPYKITKQSRLRYFLDPINILNIFQLE